MEYSLVGKYPFVKLILQETKKQWYNITISRFHPSGQMKKKHGFRDSDTLFVIPSPYPIKNVPEVGVTARLEVREGSRELLLLLS